MQVCCFFFFLIVGLCGLTVIIQTALLRLEFHGALLEKKKKSPVKWNNVKRHSMMHKPTRSIFFPFSDLSFSLKGGFLHS